MRNEPDAEEDQAADVNDGLWDVVQVRPLPGYRLEVQFADGTSGEVDVSRLICGPQAGVFECLRDPALFSQVAIEYGAVTWPGELDLAPDAMYDEIRAHGSWTPG